MTADHPSLESNRRLGWKLAGLAVLMLGFGYALVPLYQVYCKVTGLNGTTRTIDTGEAITRTVDVGRSVTVEFLANVSGNLPWEFRATTAQIPVHPGQLVVARFRARNMGNTAIVGQAVPSVTPFRAAPYFKKVECFCFTRQPLAPGESRDMPVQFLVDPSLPPDIQTMTLSYTFFEIPPDRLPVPVQRASSTDAPTLESLPYSGG